MTEGFHGSIPRCSKQTQFHYSGPGAIYFFDHISPHTDTIK